MSVRIGAIGVGHWHAPRHLHSFSAAGATVAAVHADEPGVAEDWARRLSARSYANHRELLHDGGVDLVVAMPRHRDGPSLLADLTARGLPFVIEKPAATSAADLLPHVLAVEAGGQFAAVPFVNRYGTFWSRLRDMRLDPVSTARFRIVNGPPGRYVDDGVGWVLDAGVSGGGALRNLGTHVVDAYLTLADGPVEVIGSALTNRLHGLGVEEHAIALLRDAAGLIGVVEAGYSRPDADGTDQEWCVAGAGGYLRELHDRLEVVTTDKIDIVDSPSVMQRYRLFAEDVLRCLAAGAPPPITLRDCWRAVELIDRIYASARHTPTKSTRRRHT